MLVYVVCVYVCVSVCLSNQKVEVKKKKKNRREKGLICCAETEQIQDSSFKQKFKRSISTRREVAGTGFKPLAKAG